MPRSRRTVVFTVVVKGSIASSHTRLAAGAAALSRLPGTLLLVDGEACRGHGAPVPRRYDAPLRR